MMSRIIIIAILFAFTSADIAAGKYTSLSLILLPKYEFCLCNIFLKLCTQTKMVISYYFIGDSRGCDQIKGYIYRSITNPLREEVERLPEPIIRTSLP